MGVEFNGDILFFIGVHDQGIKVMVKVIWVGNCNVFQGIYMKLSGYTHNYNDKFNIINQV